MCVCVCVSNSQLKGREEDNPSLHLPRGYKQPATPLSQVLLSFSRPLSPIVWCKHPFSSPIAGPFCVSGGRQCLSRDTPAVVLDTGHTSQPPRCAGTLGCKPLTVQCHLLRPSCGVPPPACLLFHSLFVSLVPPQNGVLRNTSGCSPLPRSLAS